MEAFNKHPHKYGQTENEQQVKENTARIIKSISPSPDKALVEKLFSLIDLTTLNTDDSKSQADRFCRNVNDLNNKFPGIPNVAAICVYPSLVSRVRKNLKVGSVKLAAVGAGFPSSQTFLSVKMAECALLVEKGADEIDIVISVGKFLEGDFQRVFDEIHLIKNNIGDVHLKVILETGLLKTPDNIRMASLLAMEAGADFIKTSTGKLSPAATPEAVYVMLKAIKDFNEVTHKKVGIKPAGGIASLDDALVYHALVDHVVGREWLKPELFRLGASRLANNLLSEILKTPVSHF